MRNWSGLQSNQARAMKAINLLRRLEALEEQLTNEPIVLLMPDGRKEALPGHNDYALNLLWCAVTRFDPDRSWDEVE